MSQPITVTVGPLATADADGVSLSQTAAAAQSLVINGALAGTTFDADSIAASQTPGGAGALTLDGALVTGGVAYLPSPPAPQRVYITSAGDDSGVTFTVTGTVYSLTGPAAVSETVTGANTSTVATTDLFSTVTGVTISGAAAGAVTVGHSGTATTDLSRHIIITSAGNDTGITFTVSGTDWSGNSISETITGANIGAASGVLDFKTVTGVTTSDATADAVTVGTNGVAGSPWVRFDDYGSVAQVALQATVSGTVNYTVQSTMEDPNLVTNQIAPNTFKWTRSGITWVNSSDSAVVNATATKQSTFSVAPVFARVLLNSGTGTVTTTFRQAYQD